MTIFLHILSSCGPSNDNPLLSPGRKKKPGSATGKERSAGQNRNSNQPSACDLYVPLSITGFFGMIGESFIGTETVLQLALCELIGILGIGTPVAAYGGLVVSLKLRSCEHSRQSFLYQFSGLVYLLLLSALSAIPFCL